MTCRPVLSRQSGTKHVKDVKAFLQIPDIFGLICKRQELCWSLCCLMARAFAFWAARSSGKLNFFQRRSGYSRLIQTRLFGLTMFDSLSNKLAAKVCRKSSRFVVVSLLLPRKDSNWDPSTNPLAVLWQQNQLLISGLAVCNTLWRDTVDSAARFVERVPLGSALKMLKGREKRGLRNFWPRPKVASSFWQRSKVLILIWSLLPS